jgi:hypothetical protein
MRLILEGTGLAWRSSPTGFAPESFPAFLEQFIERTNGHTAIKVTLDADPPKTLADLEAQPANKLSGSGGEAIDGPVWSFIWRSADTHSEPTEGKPLFMMKEYAEERLVDSSA